jgi:hypothetical protein
LQKPFSSHKLRETQEIMAFLSIFSAPAYGTVPERVCQAEVFFEGVSAQG